MALTKIRGNTQLKSGTITNTEIAADAAIVLSKLAQGADIILRDGSVAFTGNINAGSNKITNVGTPTASGDATSKTYVDTELQALRDIVIDDLDPRLDAIEASVATAEGDIDALEGRMTTAEGDITSLEAAVTAETSRAGAAEGVLQGNIDDEETARIAAVSALQSELDGTQSDLADEETRATAAEDALDARMDTAESDITALETADGVMDGRVTDLENGLSAETTSRQNADTALASDISDEETRATAAEVVLQGNIDDEETARIAAISAEETARLAEDETLLKVDGSRAVQGTLNVDYAVVVGNGDEAVEGSGLVLGTNAVTLHSTQFGMGPGPGEMESKSVAYMDAGTFSLTMFDENLAAIAGVSMSPTSGFQWGSAPTENSHLTNKQYVDQQIVDAEAALQGNIDDEETRALAAEAAIASDLADEETRATAAEAAIASDLADEETRATAAEGVLQGNIDDEETARIAQDAATLASANSYTDTEVAALVNSAPGILDTLKELADAIGSDANFATTVANQIAGVQAEVDAEEVRAAAAEVVLQDNIDDEETRATAAEAAIASDLADEETRATAAEVVLQGNIDDEETRALAAEVVLQGNIDDEETRATAAEVVLQGNIDDEETRALAAEAALSSDISDEASARTADVDAEETRALAAEGVLQGNIDDEETRALAAEGVLSSDMDAVEGRMTTAEADIAALENTVLYVSNVVTRESPSGSINGSNVVYGLAHTPVANSEHVYLNGLLQEPGIGNDYAIDGDEVTFNSAPVSGDRLRVSYLKSQLRFIKTVVPSKAPPDQYYFSTIIRI